jgi:uncharacterized protein
MLRGKCFILETCLFKGSTGEKNMEKCLRTVLWRNDAFDMFEYCALKDTGQGSLFEGVVVTAVDEKPLRISYQVVCDEQGLTNAVVVDAVGGLGEHHIALAVDAQRRWYWNGKELPECSGFSDVDLGFSPATNSLPIRRLNMKPGESQTLSMAWVRFPEFDVIPFPQRYTRLDSHRYQYESLISDFKAELVVDELGIVQQYDKYWKAAATGQAC